MNIFKKFFAWISSNSKTRELDIHLAEVRKMQLEYEDLLKKNPAIYTTIKTFRGLDDQFWGWLKTLEASDEYRFLIFTLRENAIGEIVANKGDSNIHELIGRLQMVRIIDNYIQQGLRQYEDKLRRDKEALAG
jgi:hypothetical protein